jgi:hypothetical protein
MAVDPASTIDKRDTEGRRAHDLAQIDQLPRDQAAEPQEREVERPGETLDGRAVAVEPEAASRSEVLDVAEVDERVVIDAPPVVAREQHQRNRSERHRHNDRGPLAHTRTIPSATSLAALGKPATTHRESRATLEPAVPRRVDHLNLPGALTY